MKSTSSFPGFIGWLLLTFLAPLTAIRVKMGPWFEALHKPEWNPPGWIFGPVWTALYILMAVAAWLAWRAGSRGGLTLYIVSLILNAIWTPLFFGEHRPDLALLDIALLWITILATFVAFTKVSRAAAWLLVPYLAWVTFATALNASIWFLN